MKRLYTSESDIPWPDSCLCTSVVVCQFLQLCAWGSVIPPMRGRPWVILRALTGASGATMKGQLTLMQPGFEQVHLDMDFLSSGP